MNPNTVTDFPKILTYMEVLYMSIFTTLRTRIILRARKMVEELYTR